MSKTYYFEILTPGCALEGEEFLVEAKDLAEASSIAKANFPGEWFRSVEISALEAEMLGLDTY